METVNAASMWANMVFTLRRHAFLVWRRGLTLVESIVVLTSLASVPDMDRVCTSHVERLNLTLRMQSRRFTRLTNAHSKSLDHHKAMLAIFFAWYNFCRVHASLRGQTPAMRYVDASCSSCRPQRVRVTPAVERWILLVAPTRIINC